jgi:hypothetical protein
MLGLHIAPYKQWLTEWWMIPPGIVPVVRYNSTMYLSYWDDWCDPTYSLKNKHAHEL